MTDRLTACDLLTVKPKYGNGDKQDDQTLIVLAKTGDEWAWEIIIARYTPYLSSIGRAYYLSREEVSDALQETWMSVVAHLSDLRDPARFRPWMATIMRRGCMEMIQRRRRDREQLAGDLTGVACAELRDERVDIEHEVLAAERSSILRQALCLLPQRERELLNYLTSDDLSYDEIARRLSIPVGSIGPTRMRALRRLRLILEQRNADDLLRVA